MSATNAHPHRGLRMLKQQQPQQQQVSFLTKNEKLCCNSVKLFIKQRKLLGLNGAIAQKRVVIRLKQETMELKLKHKIAPIFHNAVCII